MASKRARQQRVVAAIILSAAASSLAVSFLLLHFEQFRLAAEGLAWDASPARLGRKFPRRPEVATVDCARLLAGDGEYAKEVATRRPAMRLKDTTSLPACDAVRSRVLPPRNADTGYPIAFAKTVFQDYDFLEEQLAVSYATENWYCFALDKKSPLSFRRRMVALAACLPNVLLAQQEWPLDSAGHFQNNAHFGCLKELRRRPWNYVILLQNYDVIIKTHAELTWIFQKGLAGSNDWTLLPPMRERVAGIERRLGPLGICPKGLRGAEREACERSQLTWAKGGVHMSLARPTVDYLLEQLDYRMLLARLNQKNYGVDESLLQTLAATRALGLPGGFHAEHCLQANSNSSGPLSITRLAHWSHTKKHAGAEACRSGHWRHGVCIFGVEDLPMLAAAPQIVANKLMPSFDYAAISCLGELLFNRSVHGLLDHPLQKRFYCNLPQVRFDRARASGGSSFNITDFPCSPEEGEELELCEG